MIHLNNDSKNILRQILKPELRVMLEIIDNRYAGMPIPDKNNYQTILDMIKGRWLRCSTITSKQIRLLIREAELITNTKIIIFTPDEAAILYKNIKQTDSEAHKIRQRC